MVSAVTTIQDAFLSLSAQDLRELTNWPDALIEDYLSILRNLLELAAILDVDIDGQISANHGLASQAIAKLSHLGKVVADLDQSHSANFNLIQQALGALMRIGTECEDAVMISTADHSNSLSSMFGVFGSPP